MRGGTYLDGRSGQEGICAKDRFGGRFPGPPTLIQGTTAICPMQKRDVLPEPGRTPAAISPSSATPIKVPGVARQAGRGGLAVSAAKLYFILIGLVQQIALKAVLGLDGYGALSSALSAASITYNPIVTASLQGMAQAVATSSPEQQRTTVQGAMRLHAVLAVVTFAVFFLAAPALGRLTGAPHIVPALRLLSSVLLVYGLYAPLVGVLNGKMHFTTQAALDTLAATLRTIGLVGGAWAFAGLPGGAVSGAALGFSLSSALVLSAAAWKVRRSSTSPSGQPLPPFARAAYLKFVGPILVGQLLLNLLFQSDQLLLRRFAAQAALAVGLEQAAADPFVGAYRAIQLFCFLPYQLVLAVSTILFPLLASAQRDGHSDKVRAYVLAATRLALLVCGSIVCVTASLPEALLRLVFGADTAALGSDAMLWLAPGLSSLALLGLLTAILNSLQNPRQALAVIACAVALVLGLCLRGVQGHELGVDLLRRTAIATSTGLMLATASACILVHRRARGLVVPLAAARIVGCLTITVWVARQLPLPSRLMTLPLCALVATSYGLLLIVTGELGRADLQQLQAIIRRRSRGTTS